MKHGIETFAVGMTLATALALTAGVSWEVTEECPDTCNLRGVAFATTEKGFAYGEGNETLVFTVDGGLTWKSSTLSAEAKTRYKGCPFYDGMFSDGLTGWALGSFDTGAPPGKRIGYLFKTTDGGATWTEQALPDMIVNGNPWRIWFDQEGNGWLLPGQRHAIFRTSDGGKTWKQLMFGKTHPLLDDKLQLSHTGLHVFDAKHLILCGQFGLIVHTEDGGESWAAATVEPETSNAPMLYDIAFSGQSQGWAVGEKGAVFHTADGGQSWERQKCDVPNTLSSVAFANKIVGFAVGRAVYEGSPTARFSGVLLKTRNGGKTWENVNPTCSSLVGICCLDENHAWAVGGVGGSGNEPKVMILRYAKEK